FPEPLARVERARAEFIRLQCGIARRGPGGWGGDRYISIDPALAERPKRLIPQHREKWRRAFPVTPASGPVVRGYLRPVRALRPEEFLDQIPPPPLPPDSPAGRYVPPGSTFLTCPLWDIHLYTTPFTFDPRADRGQYTALLAEVGRSPHLARAG